MATAGDAAQEFMSRVVPWPVDDRPGFVNLHWLRPGIRNPAKLAWSGKVTRTPVDFLSNARWGMNQPTIKDIYFCLSLQSRVKKTTRGSFVPERLQANAISIRALWLDLDVIETNKAGKGYPTTADALDALAKFIAEYKLPPVSSMVASGSGGVHVYWFSDRDLTRTEWQPYANGLKQAALDFGLKCDLGCTVDSARVLRVPGTLNHKHTPPKPVKLLGIRPRSEDYDFALVFKDLPTPTSITSSGEAGPAFEIPFAGQKVADIFRTTGEIESLGSGIEKYSDQPLDWKPLVAVGGCPFIQEALRTGGKNFSQPEWNLTTLAATFMEDGDALAHKMGNRHDGYTRESTDELLERKKRERKERSLGWPSCRSIQTAGFGGCAGCPHLAKGKSPLHLTGPVQPAALAAAFTAAVTAPLAAQSLCLPPGFALNKDGLICKEVETQEGDQPPTTVQLPLFHCKISSPWMQKDGEGSDAVNFSYTTDIGNTRQTSLSMRFVAKELCAELAARGVNYIPEQKRFLESFFMAWVNKLWSAQEATTSRMLGWHEDAGKKVGFVYGGSIHHADGTETPAGYGDAKTRELYKPCGSVDAWWEAYKMVRAENRPELYAIIATAFAAPLMRSAGVPQVLYSTWGPSGGRKTSAIRLAGAVWGHPKKNSEGAFSTARSVMERMGSIKHLPLYWDEIKDEKSQSACVDSVFGQEGIGAGRLTANIEQRDKAEWQTMLIIGSNISLVDHIVRKHPSHVGSLMRVFEVKVLRPDPASAPGLVDTIDADRIVQDLESNYGHIGVMYAKLLAQNVAAVDALTEQISKQFQKELCTSQEERRWLGCITTLFAGATLAGQLEIDLDLPELRKYLIAQFLLNRARGKDEGQEAGTNHSTLEAVNGFLQLYNPQNAVWTNKAHLVPGKAAEGLITVLHGPAVNNARPIYVQYCLDDRLLRIDRKELVAYLTKMNLSPRTVTDGLKEHYHAKIASGRLAGGTQFRQGQLTLVHIPVPPGSPFEDVMFTFGAPTVLPAFDPGLKELAHGPAADSPLDTALAAVQANPDFVGSKTP